MVQNNLNHFSISLYRCCKYFALDVAFSTMQLTPNVLTGVHNHLTVRQLFTCPTKCTGKVNRRALGNGSFDVDYINCACAKHAEFSKGALLSQAALVDCGQSLSLH